MGWESYVPPTEAEFAAALALHRQTLVADGHCDSILAVAAGERSLTMASPLGHLDFPRARQAGLGLQVFTCWPAPEHYRYPARRTFTLLELLLQQIEAAQDEVLLCRTGADVTAAQQAGKLAALINIEGGEVLEGSLAVLHILYRLGVRVMQPVWNHDNDLAAGNHSHRKGSGLSEFGRAFVREMNALGMALDLSHLPPAGFAEVCTLTTAPLLFTHGNCRALHDHPRNLTDAQIKALAATGGVFGISFVTAFMADSGRPGADVVARHIDHVCQLLGDCEHVGYGSDFDGTDSVPQGLEDITRLPNLTAELIGLGYRGPQLAQILGGNYCRVFGEILHG